MKILIVGAGAVGSTLAVQLVQAGHDISLLARGLRLAELSERPVIEARHMVSGRKSQTVVKVLKEVDAQTAWDLVIVTVQAQQLDGVVPLVTNLNTDTFLFMMNMVGDWAPVRTQVGRDRFLVGLPALLAGWQGTELQYAILPSYMRLLQITTIGGLSDHEPAAASRVKRALDEAGVATAIERDMSAWLLTHAAFMMPIMVASLYSGEDRCLSWRAASLIARAMLGNFRLLVENNRRITPWNMRLVEALPWPLLAISLWTSFRVRFIRMAAQAHVSHASGEVHHLIEALQLLDPQGRVKTLSALRQFVDELNGCTA